MIKIIKITLVTILSATILPAKMALCVTQYKEQKFPYVKDPSVFRASLPIEAEDRHIDLSIPQKTLYKRLKFAKQDQRIESVQLNLFKDTEKLKDLAIDLSRPGKSKALLRHFRHLMKNDQIDEKSEFVRVALNHKSLRYIDPKKLSSLHEQGHKHVKIYPENIRKSTTLRRELMAQLNPFLPPKQLQAIQAKIRNNQPLNLQEDLLTGFSKKMAGNYTIFKGPNCFHAALAFHARDLSDSPFLNVKIEKGYHRAMINYDELWKAINHHFHEVDPRKSALKYGDLLIFMDVPDDSRAPYFKWIRHAATYLMGQYTFSKGSKSANTPYSIKTLQEEWRTWKGYTNNLRVKVFRRSQNHVNKRPPKDLTDWIY